MYFGIYQIASRHREFDALRYEAQPSAAPGLFARLFAWIRSTFR
jgi:hypothetical protein